MQVIRPIIICIISFIWLTKSVTLNTCSLQQQCMEVQMIQQSGQDYLCLRFVDDEDCLKTSHPDPGVQPGTISWACVHGQDESPFNEATADICEPIDCSVADEHQIGQFLIHDGSQCQENETPAPYSLHTFGGGGGFPFTCRRTTSDLCVPSESYCGGGGNCDKSCYWEFDYSGYCTTESPTTASPTAAPIVLIVPVECSDCVSSCTNTAVGYYRNCDDDSAFVHCDEFGALHNFQCGVGMVFDDKANTCVFPPSSCDPTTTPTTASPTTTSPTSSSPTTSLPTTTIPTSASPTTSLPTTTSPTSASPTTASPTSSSPTTASPTTSLPTTSLPTSASPTTASPTTASPTTVSPTSAAPTTTSPTTTSPTTTSPTSSSPTTSSPTTVSPTTTSPTTTSPTSSSPTTASPTTASPTTASPTTTSPTTASPTTSLPTTASPTTASPTTVSPTSASPTTTSPTSSSPTTTSPTTASPTTASPTSSYDPTTASPTTASPTTASPTSPTAAPIVLIVPVECSECVSSCTNTAVGYYRDCDDDSAFVHCDEFGALHNFQCNVGMVFDDKVNNCVFPPSSCDPTTTVFPCDDCPICGDPDPPTTQPSEEPEIFDQHCNCICYGDPHCKMWNCAMNNWQGPHGVEAPGNVYYMTRCAGVEHKNVMPFDLIASIQRFDTYFTSLEHTILRLWDGNDDGSDGDEYCIKNKGNEGVSFNTDCSDIYPITPDENTPTIIGGSITSFSIEWKFENGYSRLLLNVLGDECDWDLEIITQTAFDGQEMVEIRVSECYKAFTCGMCGNFYNTGHHFERSDGSFMTLDAGAWGGTANDADALSYLVEPERRRRQLVEDVTDFTEPCFGKRLEIGSECNEYLRDYAACCWDRKQFCEEMIISCSWDSCACVMDQGEHHHNISECVTNTLNASMTFVCGLGADSFVSPDMSVYDNVVKEESEIDFEECDSCNANRIGYVFIGIGLAAILFCVIGCCWHIAVVKPKLGALKLHLQAEKMNKLHVAVVDFSPTPNDVEANLAYAMDK